MDPYLAEIKIMPTNFAPRGWAFCEGQLLSIASNTALFSLLGTNYGGNGQTTFGLPDLRGRSPLHEGQGPGLSSRTLGEIGGAASVTLLQNEMPAHGHTPAASSQDGNQPGAAGNNFAVPGAGRGLVMYHTAGAGGTVTMAPDAAGMVGGNQPHNNLMPYLAVNFCICISGIFPSRP